MVSPTFSTTISLLTEDHQSQDSSQDFMSARSACSPEVELEDSPVRTPHKLSRGVRRIESSSEASEDGSDVMELSKGSETSSHSSCQNEKTPTRGSRKNREDQQKPVTNQQTDVMSKSMIHTADVHDIMIVYSTRSFQIWTHRLSPNRNRRFLKPVAVSVIRVHL